MRGSSHIEPVLAGQLIGTGQLANARTEHLGPTAGHGAQTCLHQLFQGRLYGFTSNLGKMVNFHTGEGLDMHPWPLLLNGAQHVQVVGKR